MEEKKAVGRRFVVVTTEKKGVFGGYVAADAPVEGTVRLEEAQMCVYWDSDCKGVLGVAAKGPGSGSRISPEVPAITLFGVTAVMETTSEAEAAWKSKPWN